MKTISLLAAFLICASTPVCIFAQTPSTVITENQPTSLLDAAAVFAAAKDVSLEKYPDADEVIVDDITRVIYREDGSADKIGETWSKVLTEKGKREAQVSQFSYNIFYTDFAVLTLELHKPDGSVVQLDPVKLGKEIIDSSSAQANIYDPNNKKLAVSVKGVEIGDVVRIVVKEHGKKPRAQGIFADENSFESSSPIVRSRYEVSGPESLPLKSAKVVMPIGSSVTHEQYARDGRQWQAWEARNVPRFFEEPSMPSPFSCTQMLLVSSVTSWEDISRWYFDLSKEHLSKTTPEMKTKAEELVKDAKNREERIRAIFRFVSQDIRYMGVMDETCSPGYEPHDVSLSFNKKYGVCRDKAALLVSMLNLIGEKAFPVLIMAGPRLQPDVPMPFFNHAITALQETDGSFRLMDSTDENTADLLPSYLNNKSFLVASPTGETLRVSPVPSVDKEKTHCSTHANISDEGVMSAAMTIEPAGFIDNVLRGALGQAPPQVVHQSFEKMIKSIAPGAELSMLTITPQDARDTSQPLSIHLEFKAPDALNVFGDKSFFKAPWMSQRILQRVLGQMCGLEKRRFDLTLPSTVAIAEDLEIKLPSSAGTPLALPTTHNINTDELSFNQDTQVKDGVLKAHFELQLKKPEITPAGYATLRDITTHMDQGSREESIFAAKKSAADIHVFESKITYDLKDAHTWTETYKTREEILTYNGKKEEGELHIAYNPIWEKVSLKKARVIAKDGSFKDVSEKEINTLDANWAASAKRYPASKTMVVSLPSLEIGSVVELEYAIEKQDQLFFSSRFAFADVNPCDKVEYEVNYPKDLELTFEDQSQANATNEAGHFYVAREMVVVPHEGSMAPLESFAPFVAVSGGDGAHLYETMAQTVAGLGNGGDVIATKAKAIAVGNSDREKIIALRDFVAKNIRSSGPSLNEVPLSALSKPEVTLADGYGSEADRAILLNALLSAVGIESRVALVSHNKVELLLTNEDSPLQRYFYDSLVCIASLNKKEVIDTPDVFLDNINQYAKLGTSSLEYCEMLGINGQPNLIFVDMAYKTKARKEIEAKVNADGSATLKIHQDYTGVNYGSFRQTYSEMPPEEKRREFETLVHSIAPDASALSELKINYSTYPGTRDFTVKVPHFAVSSGTYFYFDLPLSVTTLSRDAATNKRATPLLMGSTEDSEIVWDVTLPDGYTLKSNLPHFHWADTIDIQGEQEGKQLHIKETIYLNPEILSPADYQSLLEVNKEIAKTPWRVLLQKN